MVVHDKDVVCPQSCKKHRARSPRDDPACCIGLDKVKTCSFASCTIPEIAVLVVCS